MHEMSGVQVLGLVASVILPLWNIPLIMRIIQRKTSDDISLLWALGVWICLVLMAPSGFTSHDIVWRVFNIVNVSLFTGVMVTVVWYRMRTFVQKRFLKKEPSELKNEGRFTIEP